MANEFVIKKGLLVQGGQNQITGSLTVSGSVSASLFLGPITGTSSFSVSASYWDSSSVNSWTTNNFQFKIATGSTLPITSSWATNTVNAAFVAGTMSTGSTYPITSSVAITASYWDSSSVNSWTTNNFQFKVATGSSLPVTSSQSITASYWDSSSVNSWANNNFQFKIATGSTLPVTSSVAITASYALNAVAGGLATGSTYPITSSQSVTASYWNSSSVNSWTTNNFQFKIATGSTVPVTASWATNTVNAAFVAGTMSTGSTYPITASRAVTANNADLVYLTNASADSTLRPLLFAPFDDGIFPGYNAVDSSGINVYAFNKTIFATASIATSASYWNSSSVNSWVANNYQLKIATGSTLPVTASQAITASYALNGGSSGGLATGSTYPITSSQAITASYWDSSSVNSWTTNNFQFKIATGSTVPVTASWATNTVNAAFVAGTMSTGSTYPITSSQSVTASYWDSGSVVNFFTTKQNNLSTGSTLPVTASWANVAVYAPVSLATGSTYPITSSQSVTASYWDSSSVNSWTTNNFQFKIATGSTLPITSSWATNTVNAAFVAGTMSTGSTYPITSSVAITASYWDSSSVNSWTTNNFQFKIATGSTVPITSSVAITASYALNAVAGGLATGSTYPITSSQSVTASYWNSSSVNSWVGNNFQFKIATGSTIPITSSFTVTASYWDSSSVNSWTTNNFQFKIATGSTLPVTSSQSATSSWTVTASYWNSSSVNSWVGNNYQSKIATGSTIPVTSSFSVTASYWDSSSVNSWTTNNFQFKLATGSTVPVTASYSISASWAPGGTGVTDGGSYNISASWASSSFRAVSASYAPGSPSVNAETASYLTPSQDYSVVTTTANWITASFGESNQQANLTATASYFFTSSIIPATGHVVDTILIISHSATTGTSSFTFPSAWKNIGGGWPTGINSSTIGVFWLRSINPELIIGSYNVVGPNFGEISASSIYISSSLKTPLHVDTFINNFAETNMENYSAGTGASADVVATNNLGSDTQYYVDMGINSSGYTGGFIGNQNDAYLYSTGSNLYIGNTSPNQNVYLFAGGTTNTGSSGIKISGSGQVTINNFTASNGYFARAHMTQIGTALTTNKSTNLTATRIALGLYGFKFLTEATDPYYQVTFCGVSQSAATKTLVTGSIGGSFNHTTTDFSMSVMPAGTGVVRAYFTSASVVVFP